MQVVLVMDRAGWHRSHELDVPDNITLFHLPPYSPELNPVERLWLWLKERHLSNRRFADIAEIIDVGAETFANLKASQVASVCRLPWLEPLLARL